MPPVDQSANSSLQHPFVSHLIALLSVYELGPSSTPIPKYEGPSDWQSQSILRSLGAMARRMYTAEEAYNSIKASERAGPDTKKRRSVGDSPPVSSPSSTSSAEFTNIVTHSDVSSQSPFFSPSNSSFDSLSSSVYQEAKERVDVDMAESETVESETTPSAPTQRPANGSSTPMTINLAGVPNPLDRTKLPNGNEHHLTCPHCGHGFTFNTSNSTTVELITGEPLSSPLVVPPGPLAAAAYESGMSAVEELKLLKQQVQDVSRVCNAVARGDLSQKITVPVQGVVMVQLKEVINAMVSNRVAAVLRYAYRGFML